MKKILLFGAGKSATVLIDYLLSHAGREDWTLIVADADLQLALDKINHSPSGEAVSFDIADEQKRRQYILEAAIVISMLPPGLHIMVARDCLRYGRHLLTASYVDDEMRTMQKAIEAKDLLFLCEMGLDPGIDHMSAMRIIDRIHGKGGKIASFKSHCGGLVAPESDNNPWHYKISWNPRNIVMAGKAGAVYKVDGEIRRKEYASLFDHCDTVNVPGMGAFAYYPNRDSLSYIPIYQLEEATTFLRTTLRHPSFCMGWKYIIDAGLTEETAFGPGIKRTGFRECFDSILATGNIAGDFNDFLLNKIEPADRPLAGELFAFLGLTADIPMPVSAKSPADLLQYAVENSLLLLPQDKDMIVMLHEFEYAIDGTKETLTSCLVVKGEDRLRTAMAKTVGLPLGIAARLILNGQIGLRGLHIPTRREIYEPVLKELEEYQIGFWEDV